MFDVVGTEAAFNAEHAVVGRSIKRGIDTVDVAVFDIQIELATDAAVGTGRAHGLSRSWRFSVYGKRDMGCRKNHLLFAIAANEAAEYFPVF